MMKLVDIDIHDERVRFVEAKPAGWAGYVPVKALKEALDEEGVPPQLHPSAPSDNRCLERAMSDQVGKGKHAMVRPLPKSRGWSLVMENSDALDLEARAELERVGAVDQAEASHSVELTAKVERAEQDGQLSTVRFHPEDHPGVPLVREAFRFHRGTDDENQGHFKASQDLSVWFSQQVIPWVRGVATRSRGGSYYVGKGEMLDRLEKVCRALAKVSEYDTEDFKLPDGNVLTRTKTVRGGRIILKPELTTQAACEVLIDSVINEMDKRVDQLDDKLRNGNMGTRALDSRAKEVEEWQDELKGWEDLLGIALTDLKDRMSEAEAGVGMAKLKIEAAKDLKENAA